MLEQCWVILQMALSSQFMLSKIIVLVMTLAKLHNSCINQSSIVDSVDETLVYLKLDENKFLQMRRGLLQ